MRRPVVFAIAGLALAVGLAALSPLASKAPDGLDSVAEKHGFAEKEKPAPFEAPIPDYWDEKGPGGKIAAGVVGTLLVFGVTAGLGWALRRRKEAA